MPHFSVEKNDITKIDFVFFTLLFTLFLLRDK